MAITGLARGQNVTSVRIRGHHRPAKQAIKGSEMSSILTNNSAMVALQTLRSINKNLGMTQSEISTGKSIGSAKDNSAVWAISKQMESDVAGFKRIQESLSLGESTIAVARSAAETVTDLLTDIKGKIVAAQEENVDRDKIQTDIDALTNQIESVVGAAQFNGLNLVDGASTDDVDILSSLDRSGGGVTASQITVERQNLSVAGAATNQIFGGTANADQSIIASGANSGTAVTVAAAGTNTTTIASVGDGFSYRIELDDTGGDNSLGTRTFEYVASDADTTADVAKNLYDQVKNFLDATGSTDYSVSRTGDEITFSNGSGGDLDVTATAATAGTAATGGAGLGALATLDVTSDAGATAALTSIETLIGTAIDAAAAFGSAQGRIETQSDFVSNLTDSLRTGIGALVDADMEEASARLQALQVQQQLATQSLSIANQAPQSILALFR
ncbi:MAG: flagellin [Pseudomonadota bacterium]